MSRKQKKSEESGPNVPAYIVTFSDMVTLLLTFFVLLLALSTDKDPAMYQIGQQAFARSLQHFGLEGILYTLEDSFDFEQKRQTFPMEEDDDPDLDKPMNSLEEQLRRLFNKVAERTDVRPSQIRGDLTDMVATPIVFEPDSSSLNQEAREFVGNLVSELGLGSADQSLTIYVVGLSPEAGGDDGWLVSAYRAEEVARYIEEQLPEGANWSVYAWGAGRGDYWMRNTATKKDKTYVMINVVRND